jgi:hypothetical protein
MDRETAEEITRHFNVVAESLRSEIRTVAEGFVSTNERLDRMETRMSERFGELEAMIRLSGVRSPLATLRVRSPHMH